MRPSSRLSSLLCETVNNSRMLFLTPRPRLSGSYSSAKGSARVYSVTVTNLSWGVGRTSGGINVAGSSTSPSWTGATKRWTSSTRTFGSITTTHRTSILSRATGQAIATSSSTHAKRTSSTVLVGSDNGGDSSTPHVPSTTPSSPAPAPAREVDPDPEIPPVNQPIDRDPSNHFVFFDLETTAAGIPYPSIRILELALCVTDKNFVPLDKGEQYFVHWKKEGVGRGRGKAAWMEREDVLEGMTKSARQMHESSGLLTAYFSTPPTRRLTLAQVEFRVIAYLARHHIRSYGVMAGAGIGYDRGMVNCHMPKLDKVMNYQTFDTTALWHLIKRKYNRTERFSVPGSHRAMGDIVGSMHEARTYAELVFKHPSEVEWPSPNGI